MKYKSKTRIKALIAAGLLTFNLSGCTREIKGYSNSSQAQINGYEDTVLRIEEFKKKLQEDFTKASVILDKTSDEFISNITIDGIDVSIGLTDGSSVSGELQNLAISDVTFENLYVYDSQYIDDLYNIKERYFSKGLRVDALVDEYENRAKLNVVTNNCSVNNQYKKGTNLRVEGLSNIDYSNCRNVWLEGEKFEESEFSMMPNLETLVLVYTDARFLEGESIKIKSDSLRNLIIDGKCTIQGQSTINGETVGNKRSAINLVDSFDFTECPNLEIVSIPNGSQETNLNGLRGLKNLKVIAFGIPGNRNYNLSGKILGDFQERIELVSQSFPTDDQSLLLEQNSFISDLSGIQGSGIEILNISFLKSTSSDMLLDTVKSLPNLKQIIGFEINNASMCSEELVEYCEENGIKHPFTEKSLDIKHKIMEIVSNVLTEDMSEEEKMKALSEYIINHMEYDSDLLSNPDDSPEKIKKGWGECLYYSVLEGQGICQGYSTYAQSLFTEAGIRTFKIEGEGHIWNLVQIDDEYYFADLTNLDSQVSEEETSFNSENVDSYYLKPIAKIPSSGLDFFTLPLDVEEQYSEMSSEGQEERIEQKGQSKIKFGDYIIQINKQDLSQNSYSKFCGIMGILSFVGLAEKCDNTTNEIAQELDDGVGLIKVSGLKELFSKLKRTQKVDTLRKKRDIANRERRKNKEAKQLETETCTIMDKENLR